MLNRVVQIQWEETNNNAARQVILTL